MIGLLGAMEAEVALIRDALDERHDETVLGITVSTGRLAGHEVVLARSGVGKVNAALATAALGSLGVEALVFTGLAGGIAPDLRIGDIVVASDLVHHDVDVTALGFAPGVLLDEPPSWVCDHRWRERARQAAKATGATVHVGRIGSGDQFIASPKQVQQLRDQFGCVATEMEGAATAQVASKLGIPAVIVRIISDAADEHAQLDFPVFLKQAAHRSLGFLIALLNG